MIEKINFYKKFSKHIKKWRLWFLILTALLMFYYNHNKTKTFDWLIGIFIDGKKI